MGEKPLCGKVALVTGGAQGIGSLIVKRFLEEGASVIIADIDEVEFERNFKKNIDKLLFVKVDITNSDGVGNLFKIINCFCKSNNICNIWGTSLKFVW